MTGWLQEVEELAAQDPRLKRGLGGHEQKMNKAKIASVLLSLLCLTSSATAQRLSYPFAEATIVNDVADATDFQFSVSGYDFSISGLGKGLRRGGGKSLSRPFSLQLDRSDYLTRAFYYAEYEKDLLLIYEVSDSEYGFGVIERLEGPTLKRKWKIVISGFNIGQGLIDDHYAYVTGIGFIGKVDLASGFYVWRHKNLYERSKHAFNSFELPEVNGPIVIFKESPDYLRKKVAIISVHRKSGKILRLDI